MYSSPSRRTSACTREANGSGMQRSLRAERPIVIRSRPSGKWSGPRSGYLTMSSVILLEDTGVLRKHQLDRTLTNDNGAGYHIVQASAMHGHGGNQETDTQQCERERITNEVTQEGAADTDRGAIGFFDTQSGRPLAERHAGEAGDHAEVQHSHQ